MSNASAPAPRRTIARAPFWVPAVAAFVVVLVLLLALPRGAATGETVAGPEVTAELGDGVTVAVLPEVRDPGWRAEFATRPYEISLHVTITNESDELFPRWYRVSVHEAGRPGDGAAPALARTDTLQTSHLGPGEQTATDFRFASDRVCGEFVAEITYLTTLEEGNDRSGVDLPLLVGVERCRAER